MTKYKKMLHLKYSHIIGMGKTNTQTKSEPILTILEPFIEL